MYAGEQLDSRDKELKNPWIEVEFQFNDPDFMPIHDDPSNEIYGKDLLDPSLPLYVNGQARSWDRLKKEWNTVRAEITLVHQNYTKR